MSDYQQQNRFPQRKKNALDNYAFRISAPVEGEQGKWSSLVWALSGNNLTIKVYTGASSDQGNNNGLIQAKLEGIHFFAFLEMIKEAIESKEEYKNKIEFSNYIYPGGKRSDKPVTLTTVYVGRNKEGLIWVSIIDNLKKERPRIQFPFGGGRNYKFKHADSSDYLPAETSQLIAKAFYNALSHIGTHLMVTEYKEPEKKNKGNNNNNRSGSGENSYYQNSNNNSSSIDDDSDIPF